MKFTALKIILIIIALLLVANCGVDKDKDIVEDSSYKINVEGKPSLYRAGNRFGWGGEDKFVDDILPVFAKRCASCHGCIDSPCQLKLTSYEGVSRGSNNHNVFGSRIMSTYQTRMQDGRVSNDNGTVDYNATVKEWREREFYSVTNYGENSIMNKLLDDAHKLTPEDSLSKSFQLYENGLKNRTFECLGPEAAGPKGPEKEKMAARAMPFGCPKLEDEHYEVLSDWLKQGAYGPTEEAQNILAKPLNENVIYRWESFLNQDGNKTKLVSRFLYEHMFFARIHFPESPGDYYELVRSWTPPGQPIDEIITKLPNDDPDAAQGLFTVSGKGNNHSTVYYRLRKYTAIVVQKNHITWALNDETMDRVEEIFYSSDWGTEPISEPWYGSYNPFEYFDEIPAKLRYTFLLESSYNIIDSLVRGDVCTGSTATYAIRDHFWVWFLDPDADPSAHDPMLGRDTWWHLNPSKVGTFRERAYLEAYENSLRQLKPKGLAVEDIWDGNGDNKNAMVTVLRHGKSASVHKGAYNGMPKTFWVLNFSNLERLYYSLVVNFNPWGTLNHRMSTWEYMSFIRSEGEEMFISFLPDEYRYDVRGRWTRGFGKVYQDIFFNMESEGRPSQVVVGSNDPVGDFVDQIVDRMSSKILGPVDYINTQSSRLQPLPSSINTIEDFEQGLSTLTGFEASFARYFPNLTVLRVGGETGQVYTVVANRGYRFHNQILMESLSRKPEKDYLSINKGIVGTYPELFIDIPSDRMEDFFWHIRTIKSEEDWLMLMDVYGQNSFGQEVQYIPREDQNFWKFLDWLHSWNIVNNPEEAGILDISEYIWPALHDHTIPTTDDAYEPNNKSKKAASLELGSHKLVLCGDEDWFAINVPVSGRLSVEVAFDVEEGDIDAMLMGNHIYEKSKSWYNSYEGFTEEVNPGTYKLGVWRYFSDGGCQNYVVYATLYEN